MSTIHSTLTAGGDWEINVKHSWRTLHRTFYEATAICPKNRAKLWDQCKESFPGTLQSTFWEAKVICCKDPRRQTRHFAPRPLLCLMKPWWNLVKPWWSLGQPSTEPFKTQPCGSPRRTCSREPETRKTWRVLVEAWSNLQWNLLAAQDRSAPEDQRHHETWRTLVWNLPRNLVAAQEGSAQRTLESPKAILPRNLYYGWRPQSYFCWGMIMMDQRSDQTTMPIDTFSRSDVMRLHVAPLLNIASKCSVWSISISTYRHVSSNAEYSISIRLFQASSSWQFLRSVKHKSLPMRTRVADPYRYHELLDRIFLTLNIENIGLGEKWYQKVIPCNEMCGNTSTAGSIEPPVARPEAALPGPNESKHIYLYIGVLPDSGCRNVNTNANHAYISCIHIMYTSRIIYTSYTYQYQILRYYTYCVQVAKMSPVRGLCISNA